MTNASKESGVTSFGVGYLVFFSYGCGTCTVQRRGAERKAIRRMVFLKLHNKKNLEVKLMCSVCVYRYV